MNKLLTFILAAVISFSTFAADEKVDTKLAIDYLVASKTDRVVNTAIDSYAQQFAKMEGFKDMSAADHANLKKILYETMGWEATKNQMAEIVVAMFTRDEIKAAMAFMRTKHGASLTAKQEEFSRQMAVVISKNLEAAFAKCMDQAQQQVGKGEKTK